MVDCKECKSRFRADQVWSIELYHPGIISKQWIDDAIAGEGKRFGFKITEAQMEQELGWIASGVFDSVEDALEKSEELVRKCAKVVGERQLKSFEVTGKGTANDQRGLFRGTTEDGTEYNGVVQDLLKSVLATNAKRPRPCPQCSGELTEPRDFNLMFESNTGAVRDEGSKVYLRPETAQGIFVNFKNVIDSYAGEAAAGDCANRQELPQRDQPAELHFPLARVRAVRDRVFLPPERGRRAWYEFWRDVRHAWYVGLGLKSDKLRLREHDPRRAGPLRQGLRRRRV